MAVVGLNAAGVNVLVVADEEFDYSEVEQIAVL